jgi:protein tyrosine phosphatase (PTP) superfamily phosphohydrolase (DUF442 family)
MPHAQWFHAWGPPGRPTPRPDLSEILPALLVGEFPTADDVAWLHTEHHVTAVVNLQDHTDLAGKGLQLADLELAYRQAGIAFHHFPVPDGNNEVLQARVPDAVATLDRCIRAGRRVYLHCNAGMNRAPTVAIAYLHERHGLSLADARTFVTARRFCVPYMRVLEAHYTAPPVTG